MIPVFFVINCTCELIKLKLKFFIKKKEKRIATHKTEDENTETETSSGLDQYLSCATTVWLAQGSCSRVLRTVLHMLIYIYVFPYRRTYTIPSLQVSHTHIDIHQDVPLACKYRHARTWAYNKFTHQIHLGMYTFMRI